MRNIVLAALLMAASTPSMAAGDPVAGKAAYAPCAACHGQAGAGTAIGPSLKGVVGRKAAGVPGFKYSEAMKASGITWTEQRLLAFLANPQVTVRGTKMYYPGMDDPTRRADVVAYLKTLK